MRNTLDCTEREALCYLWTRDADIPLEEVEDYIQARLPIRAFIVQYSDPARLAAVRRALAAIAGDGVPEMPLLISSLRASPNYQAAVTSHHDER